MPAGKTIRKQSSLSDVLVLLASTPHFLSVSSRFVTHPPKLLNICTSSALTYSFFLFQTRAFINLHHVTSMATAASNALLIKSIIMKTSTASHMPRMVYNSSATSINTTLLKHCFYVNQRIISTYILATECKQCRQRFAIESTFSRNLANVL